ncbi:MAG: hypothetical protein KF824_05450 [Fimbriimonadaceae bacterium]|nr:MAG: hypothetical protein KF824_05450 [Fimbriimonadaceae bacterium]
MTQNKTHQALALKGNFDTLQSHGNASKTIDNTQTDEQVWSRLLNREVEATEAALFAEALTGFFKALIQAKGNIQHG